MNTYQENKLLDLKAQVGEHYDDYLLIVQPKNSPAVAIGRELDWCMTAARGFLIEMKERLEE